MAETLLTGYTCIVVHIAMVFAFGSLFFFKHGWSIHDNITTSLKFQDTLNTFGSLYNNFFGIKELFEKGLEPGILLSDFGKLLQSLEI
jgi:hypothetical protein